MASELTNAEPRLNRGLKEGIVSIASGDMLRSEAKTRLGVKRCQEYYVICQGCLPGCPQFRLR
ncbi:unnamed protein product, partial [Symbiodinium sp. KB8]